MDMPLHDSLSLFTISSLEGVKNRRMILSGRAKLHTRVMAERLAYQRDLDNGSHQPLKNRAACRRNDQRVEFIVQDCHPANDFFVRRFPRVCRTGLHLGKDRSESAHLLRGQIVRGGEDGVTLEQTSDLILILKIGAVQRADNEPPLFPGPNDVLRDQAGECFPYRGAADIVVTRQATLDEDLTGFEPAL